jgi:hypothetical protein
LIGRLLYAIHPSDGAGEIRSIEGDPMALAHEPHNVRLGTQERALGSEKTPGNLELREYNQTPKAPS